MYMPANNISINLLGDSEMERRPRAYRQLGGHLRTLHYDRHGNRGPSGFYLAL